MAQELLGASFDIHGGGIDLQFPHHENEIAQSACAHPEGSFARFWLHNEMLLVEGKKMSKSLGNFFTVRDLLDQGVSGEVIRLVLLGTQYGKPMDWTDTRRAEAEATLYRWRGLVTGVAPGADPDAAMVAALADDLNTPLAIARLHEMAKALGQGGGDAACFVASARLLGLLDPGLAGDRVPADVAARIDALIAARMAARQARDFAQADRIRAILTAAGVRVADSGAAATWEPGPDFDAARLDLPA